MRDDGWRLRVRARARARVEARVEVRVEVSLRGLGGRSQRTATIRAGRWLCERGTLPLPTPEMTPPETKMYFCKGTRAAGESRGRRRVF